MNRSAIAILTIVLIAVVTAGAVFALRSGDDTGDAAPAATTTSDGSDPETAPSTTEQPAPTTSTQPQAVAYEPVFEEADCSFDQFTERVPRCGYLVVPEDRSDPDGAQVRIHVAVFSSDDPDAPTDPILYLDGGPGGETLATLQYSLEPTWSGFLENRDVVFFDQRGIGLSEPSLDCPEALEYDLSVIELDLDGPAYLEGEYDALEECHGRLVADGIDLTQYNSATNAADVADLRVALGYDEWNLLGISYGTRLAETVMRDHPAGVRSVILDSTYTPDVDLVTENGENFNRALDELFDGCAEDDACSAAYPDLEDRFYTLIEELDAAPITATVRDVFTNERYEVFVDGQTVLGSTFQGLYSESVIPVLPQMIDELERGVTTTFSLLASNQLANAGFLSYGMYLSVQCNEELSFTNEERVEAAVVADPDLEEFYRYSSILGPQGFVLCNLWDAGTADPIENEPVSSDLPTLIMAGEYDPITPPRWGEQAAETLSNSFYHEFPGVGHAVSVSGDCPLSVAVAFFDDPTVDPDTSCIDGMVGPAFSVPGGTPTGSLALVEFSESVFGVDITGVRPGEWDEVGPGAWARQSTAVDQTSIVQQAAPGETDPEVFVGLIGPQLGFEGDPTDAGTIESSGRTWHLYEGLVDGFPTDIAIGAGDGTTGLVIMASSTEERVELYDTVFLPALEAFRTG